MNENTLQSLYITEHEKEILIESLEWYRLSYPWFTKETDKKDIYDLIKKILC